MKSMAQHGEVLGVRGEVAHVGLGVTGDAVQHQQGRLRGVAGVQVAGAVGAGLEESLGELDLRAGRSRRWCTDACSSVSSGSR